MKVPPSPNVVVALGPAGLHADVLAIRASISGEMVDGVHDSRRDGSLVDAKLLASLRAATNGSATFGGCSFTSLSSSNRKSPHQSASVR
jgi:hypothetical protein